VSELQLSLLIIGAMVIGAVYAYNVLQERRLRQRLEQAFGEAPEDVLLRQEGSAARVEPQLGATPARPQQRETGPPPERGDSARAPAAFDPELDYVAEIDGSAPLAEASVDALLAKIAECGKPTRVLGLLANDGAWEELGRHAAGRYTGLKVALQLVTREGSVGAGELAVFCDAVRHCAERGGGRAACPDAQAALQVARELDAFCSGVDVAIGINVIAVEGATFAGNDIRTVAEAAGLKLGADGVFHYRDEGRRTLFTLDNHEPAPFLPEQIKGMRTRGVTLMLDVPQVAQGTDALDRMLEVARALAAGLAGTLVDDNRSPLSAAGIEHIRGQLRSIHAALAARGMPAGSERALRLFS
jgi:hypothetical protein